MLQIVKIKLYQRQTNFLENRFYLYVLFGILLNDDGVFQYVFAVHMGGFLFLSR